MGADNQAESVPERKGLPAIAKIKQDLAYRGVTGVLREYIVLTRQQAEELIAEFERVTGVLREHIVLTRQEAGELIAEFERLDSQGGGRVI
jgi:hypothetical protein